MKKKPLIVFTFLLTTLSGIAQGMDPVEGRGRLSARAIIGKAVSADNDYSSVPVRGTVGGVSMSLNYGKGKGWNEVSVVYSSGVLRMEDQPAVTARQAYYNIYYTKLFAIAAPAGSPFVFTIGTSIDFLYNKRKYNDFVNRDLAAESAVSLCGALGISYFFKEARVTIAERMAIPLVAYIAQSRSGSDGKTSWNYRFLAPHSFLRVRNMLAVEKSLNDRHSLGLCYGWNYYRIRGFREVKQASHQVGLMYSYIF
jgi:hypothetical protein